MAKSKTYEMLLKIGGRADSSLKAACVAADKNLAKLGESAKKEMDMAAKAGTLTAAAATAVAVQSVGAYTEHTKAANRLSATTGVVGEKMTTLRNVMERVYADNFGTDIQDVADTIATVNANLSDLSTEEMEKATKAALTLRDAFAYETEESTRAASAIQKNFGGSVEGAFSLIAAGAQNGLDFSGELMDTINEYSGQFSKLGFSADGMFQLLQSGADSTAWNLDKVGDAIKEFSIRSIDGSKTTADAFSGLGYDAGKMMELFAAGGDEANKAFYDVTQSLMAVDDKVRQDAIGVALFGTMWEDLGTEAMQAMSEASTATYDVQGALEQITSIMFEDLGSELEGVRRKAEEIFRLIGEQLAPYAQEGLEYISNVALPKIAQTIELVMPKLIEVANWAMENKDALIGVGIAIMVLVGIYKIGQTVLAAYTLAVNLHKIAVKALALKYPALIIAKVKDKLVTLQIYGLYVKDALIKAKNTVATVVHTAAIKAGAIASKVAAVATRALGAAIKFMTGPIGIAITVITALVAAGIWLYKNWDTVKAKAGELGAKIDAIWLKISGAVETAISAIAQRFPLLGAVLQVYWDSIKAAWENIKAIFSNIIEFIDNVFSGNWSAAWENIVAIFGNVFGLIVNLAKAPINAVIAAINWVIGKINGISITTPSWLPGGLGGKTFGGFNIPSIPQLAVGGIAMGPTLAEIGEGGEPEAVLPLSKLAALLDGWTDKPKGGDPGSPELIGSADYPSEQQNGDESKIAFAPVLNFHAPVSKTEVEEAMKLSYSEFKRMLAQVEAEKRRKRFSPA